jgi:hypothetical protein
MDMAFGLTANVVSGAMPAGQTLPNALAVRARAFSSGGFRTTPFVTMAFRVKHGHGYDWSEEALVWWSVTQSVIKPGVEDHIRR